MPELEDLFKILRGEDTNSQLYRDIKSKILIRDGEMYSSEVNYKIALEVQNMVSERVLKQNGINVLK